jgi:hypothetical protein
VTLIIGVHFEQESPFFFPNINSLSSLKGMIISGQSVYFLPENGVLKTDKLKILL